MQRVRCGDTHQTKVEIERNLPPNRGAFEFIIMRIARGVMLSGCGRENDVVGIYSTTQGQIGLFCQ